MLRTLKVGTKIYSIAVGLIVLMVVVSTFSVIMIDRVRSELELQADIFIPLSNRIASIETTVLEGEIHIERLRLALAEGRPSFSFNDLHDEIRSTVSLVEQQFLNARTLLETLNLNDLNTASIVTATRVSAALEAVRADFDDYRSSLEKLLTAHEGNRDAEVLLLDQILIEQEEQIYHRLEQVRAEMQSHVELSVAEIVVLDERLDILIITLTLAAVLLGLLISSLVTRRIVRPISDLVGGLKRVEAGDLETELVIESGDETATMADGFNEMIAGLRAKERITDTFGTYVDRRVVKALINNPAMTKPGGDRRRMTVMFSDMTGFTSLSETLPPDSLVTLLNAYFDRIASPVNDSDGVIDKFIGDSIMAYWGPPFVEPERQASLACGAALAQLELLPGFRDEVPEVLGIPMDGSRLDIHIGIATGQTLVGTVGSDQHRNYTIMGDTVNVASRLEGACKVYGARIVVDQPTRDEAEGILFRELDALRVKGRREPVRIFEPIAFGSGSETQRQFVERFENGLAAYRGLDFGAAEQAFTICLDLFPDDRATLVFLERTMALAANPPEQGWDGVWVMTSK